MRRLGLVCVMSLWAPLDGWSGKLPDPPAMDGLADCGGLPLVSRQGRLREHIRRVEEFTSALDPLDLNQRIKEDTPLMAQVKLFAPYAFFMPRRAAGLWVDCHHRLETVTQVQPVRAEIDPALDDWRNCIGAPFPANSAMAPLESMVTQCLVAPEEAPSGESSEKDHQSQPVAHIRTR